MQQAMMGSMYPQQAMGHLPMLPQPGMPMGYNPVMQQQSYGAMPAQGDIPLNSLQCCLPHRSHVMLLPALLAKADCRWQL